ncbi:MAG TPA: RNA-binding protein [Candidatus Wirthbacteria bacterium]|nr:RNA-binding protein [Candidatus Wirthbacteria bacterium]
MDTNQSSSANPTNLFVGGISYNTTEESLKTHFSQAGTVVSAKIILDRITNRSRGFGFVEMETEEEAQKAIEMFNDKEFEGRILRVNIARPKNDSGPRPNSGYEPR